MALVGYASVKKSGRIFGYVYDKSNPTRILTVDVLLSGQTVASIKCDQPTPPNAPPGAPANCGFDFLPSEIAPDWLSERCDIVVRNSRHWVNRDPWFIRSRFEVESVSVKANHALITVGVPFEFRKTPLKIELDGESYAAGFQTIDRASMVYRVDKPSGSERSVVRIGFPGDRPDVVNGGLIDIEWPAGNLCSDPRFESVTRGHADTDFRGWTLAKRSNATVQNRLRGGLQLSLEAGGRVELVTRMLGSDVPDGEFSLRGDVDGANPEGIRAELTLSGGGLSDTIDLDAGDIETGMRCPILLTESARTLSLVFESASALSLKLDEIGWGRQGFDPSISANVGPLLPVLSAPSIREWSLPLRLEEGRRVELADGVSIASKPNAAGLTVYAAPLDLNVWPEGMPDQGFGLGVRGDFSGAWYRFEFAIEADVATLPAPTFLQFVTARLPDGQRHKDRPRISKISLIARSTSDDGTHKDRALGNLARNIAIPDLPSIVSIPVPHQIWQAAQTELAFSEAERAVLTFEFTGSESEYTLSVPSFNNAADPFKSHVLENEFEDQNLRDQSSSFVSGKPGVATPAGAAGSAIQWRGDSASVDIVVPIHNGWEHVERCLMSLEQTIDQPHRVVLIDDASGEETASRLAEYATGRPWVRLIRNEKNQGYTTSSNIGLSDGQGDYVVLLNSDTICTRGWLRRLIEIADSDDSIAGVGPLSNAASVQSVPYTRSAKSGWAINELPAGYSLQQFADLVESLSERQCPEIPLLNGFCTLFRRKALVAAGFLDDVAFPMGYGEENDLCYRLAKAGNRLVVADDVYIYHVKSVSFGDRRKAILSKAGGVAIRTKHPDMNMTLIKERLEQCVPLIALRERIIAHLEKGAV